MQIVFAVERRWQRVGQLHPVRQTIVLVYRWQEVGARWISDAVARREESLRRLDPESARDRDRLDVGQFRFWLRLRLLGERAGQIGRASCRERVWQDG